MSQFDALVDQALQNQQGLNALRPVVEKEILHHDILRELSRAGLMQDLTFIGGTCLRTCYGSNRLSEDLDFAGGENFQSTDLQSLKTTLEANLQNKYGLPITVTEPRAQKQGNVATWKMQVNTRPERPDTPSQRIHLDIAAVPSYQSSFRIVQNHYGINLGTENTGVMAQSREEILTDKLVAFALRPNRIKNRDLWDIGWLTQNRIEPALELLEAKLNDHAQSVTAFLEASEQRLEYIATATECRLAFEQEMQRFLTPEAMKQTVTQQGFWSYLTETVTTVIQNAQTYLNDDSNETHPTFPM